MGTNSPAAQVSRRLPSPPTSSATAIIMNSTVRKKKSAIADAPDSSFCRPRVLDFLSFSQLSSSYHPYLRTSNWKLDAAKNRVRALVLRVFLKLENFRENPDRRSKKISHSNGTEITKIKGINNM